MKNKTRFCEILQKDANICNNTINIAKVVLDCSFSGDLCYDFGRFCING